MTLSTNTSKVSLWGRVGHPFYPHSFSYNLPTFERRGISLIGWKITQPCLVGKLRTFPA